MIQTFILGFAGGAAGALAVWSVQAAAEIRRQGREVRRRLREHW